MSFEVPHETSSLAVAETPSNRSVPVRLDDDLDNLQYPNMRDHVGIGMRPGYQAPHSERTNALVLGDMVAAVFAANAAFYLWHLIGYQTFMGSQAAIMARLYWFPPVVIIWMALAWLFDMYDPVPSSNYRELLHQVMAVGLTAFAIGVTAFFFFPAFSPRLFPLLFLPIVAALVCLWRGSYAVLSNRFGNVHRVLFLGDKDAMHDLKAAFGAVPFPKYELVAWTEEATLAHCSDDLGSRAFFYFVQRANICEIVICSDMGFLENKLLRELVKCHGAGIRITSMPDVYGQLCRQIPVKHVGNEWIVEMLLDHPLFTRAQMGIKRLIDLCGSILALPVLAFLAPFVAAAIRLESRGPVFYSQVRSGRCGRPFSIVKFRTMRTDAESDGVARWADKNDSRITRVGRFLRKTRMDELPQILNVLKGEMSLVGPRPERPEIELALERRLPHYAIRQAVKPGVTGWAQIHYRYGNSVEDSLRKLQYDLYYIRRWSLQLDLYIILRTLGVVFKFKGQ